MELVELLDGEAHVLGGLPHAQDLVAAVCSCGFHESTVRLLKNNRHCLSANAEAASHPVILRASTLVCTVSGTTTIYDVELLEVGEDWNLSTGVRTFTREDLVAAIAAYSDPAVPAPIIKLGHHSVLNQGTPAFGRVINLRLSGDGMTLIGDLAGVPNWLAAAAPTMYPRRSMEGAFGVATQTGHTHDFMLTAVALLGTEYPAITTLEDLRLVAEAESIDELELVAASQFNTAVAAQKGPDMPFKLGKKKPEKVEAATAVEDVRRAYYDQLDQDDYWNCWIREIHVDPAELIVTDERIEPLFLRVPYSVSNDEVTFGEAKRVKQVFEDVADEVAASQNPGIVVYATKEESNPANNGQTDLLTNNEVPSMTPDQLKALGLEEGATQEQIDTALADVVARANASNTEPEGEGEGQGEGEGTQETPPGSPPVVVPQQQDDGAKFEVPDGMVLMDAQTAESMKVAATRANDLYEERRVQKRDELIAAAQGAGKFAPAQASHYRDMYDRDAKGTEELINIMASGVIPVQEIGRGDDVDASASDGEYSYVGLTPGEIAEIEARKNRQEA